MPGRNSARNRRARTPLQLPCADAERLHRRLRRFVCSAPWEESLYSGIIAGRLPYRTSDTSLEHAMANTYVYPPGGWLTAMVRCRECRRWTPPGAVGSASVCLDCFYAGLPMAQMVRIPSSPGVFGPKRAELLAAGGFQFTKQRRRYLRDPETQDIPARRTWLVTEEIETADGEVWENDFEVSEGGSAVSEAMNAVETAA